MRSIVPRPSVATRLHRRWVGSLGVQAWLMDAGRRALASLAQRLSDELSISSVPPSAPSSRGESAAPVMSSGLDSRPHSSEGSAAGASAAVTLAGADGGLSTSQRGDGSVAVTSSSVKAALNGDFPSTQEGVRDLILHLRATLEHLDDVDQFELVGAVDDDMYYLWKELERKMQRHRQSEAKVQLKDMFRI